MKAPDETWRGAGEIRLRCSKKPCNFGPELTCYHLQPDMGMQSPGPARPFPTIEYKKKIDQHNSFDTVIVKLSEKNMEDRLSTDKT